MNDSSLHRSVVPAFAVSVAFHALAFWGGGFLPASLLDRPSEPVVELVPVASVPQPVPPAKPVPKPKALSYPPMKREKTAAPAAPKPPATAPKAAARESSPAPSSKPLPPAPAPVKRDRELLSEKSEAGKLFNGYFRAVRRRIDLTVRREYENAGIGKGDVSLVFVLNSSGRLEQVQAIASPDATADVRAFAVRCLRESAPFPPFPQGLEAARISFNVTLLFEDM